jgi:hypothetical protein
MPSTVITSQDASKKGLLASVDNIVWVDKVQWAFSGDFRWVL